MNFGRDGQGGFIGLRDHNSFPIPQFQEQSRDHSSGSDAGPFVSSVVSECERSVG